MSDDMMDRLNEMIDNLVNKTDWTSGFSGVAKFEAYKVKCRKALEKVLPYSDKRICPSGDYMAVNGTGTLLFVVKSPQMKEILKPFISEGGFCLGDEISKVNKDAYSVPVNAISPDRFMEVLDLFKRMDIEHIKIRMSQDSMIEFSGQMISDWAYHDDDFNIYVYTMSNLRG